MGGRGCIAAVSKRSLCVRAGVRGQEGDARESVRGGVENPAASRFYILVCWFLMYSL